MSFKVRGFKSSDKVLGTFATREAAESFVDDYVTEHGGVLMIEDTKTKAPIYNVLQLTRCDNTEHTYDVESNWRGTGWVWLARVVLDTYTIDLEITRGSLTPDETSAVRTRLAKTHGRVCTVQL